MYTANVQSVLRCGRCHKPFDKRKLYFHQTSPPLLIVWCQGSTLKRHGYYCRSRRSGSTFRPQACFSCAKGKVGCDNRQPECSRCISKAIKCQYPAKIPRVTEPRIETNDDTPNEGEDMTLLSVADYPSVDNGQKASDDSNVILDGTLVSPNLDFINLGGENLDEDDLNIDFSDFVNPQTNDQDLESESLSPIQYPTPSIDQTGREQQDLFASSSSIPSVPSSIIRLLIHRPKMQTGAQRIANLILHNLKSYPLMMLRYKTLPPFIHPSLVASDIENVHMEALNKCISLVHMISSGVRGSRMLFWHNVRMECERFSREVR
jgi:hypothetical protein